MLANPVKNFLQRRDGSRMSQYLAAISASIAMFTAGIHLGWPAPFLKVIMSPAYPFELSQDEGSIVAIISCVGHVIGGVSAATVGDIVGRKPVLLSVVFPQVSALIMVYLSHHSKYLLYTSRIVGGIGEGVTLTILPIYVAEVSEPEIRGFVGTLLPFVVVSGVLFVNLLGSHVEIYTTALICVVFPVIYMLLFVNFPESPYYLLMKKQTEQAVTSLKVLRRRDSVWKEADNLAADVERQMTESGGYKDLFTITSNRKAFLLVSAARFFQQFTGCSAYGLYCHILLKGSTNVHPVLGSSLLMVTQMIVISLSSLFIDKCRRKSLLTLSAGFSSLMLFIQGSFAILKTYTSLDLSQLQWFPLFVMVFLLSFYTMGLGVCLNVFTSEIYSSSIKAKALSLGSVVYAVTMMASTKYYQYTADNHGMALPFYTFSLCTFVGTLFFHFFLPETKGKTLEAIQQDLKGIPKGRIPFHLKS